MVQEFISVEDDLKGKEFRIVVKPFGTGIFWTGQQMLKKSKKKIAIMDMLMSDLYSGARYFLNDKVPAGYYTYNAEVNKMISDTFEVERMLYLPIQTIILDEAFIKLMRMNHVNNILSRLGFTEHKKVIHSLLFKPLDSNRVSFKHTIKKYPNHDIPGYIVKMLGYKFFYSRMEVINTFMEKENALLSITNQIFAAKVTPDLDISTKMVVSSNMSVRDPIGKLDFLKNRYVINIITENKHLYYVYISLMHILSNRKYDEFITDTKVKDNIAHYREVISSEPKVLPFKDFQECMERIKI